MDEHAMKCEVCDILGALEGTDPASAAHAAQCERCGQELRALRAMLRDLDAAFLEQLRSEAAALPAAPPGRVPLPPEVAGAVAGLRRRHLIETMRERFRLSLEAARRLVDGMIGGGQQLPSGAPASPRRLVEPEEEPLEREPGSSGPGESQEDVGEDAGEEDDES